MSRLLKKTGKLRGRSLAELRVRAAQKLSAYAERAGLSALARVPDDAALLRMIDPARSSGAPLSVETLLEHFRSRQTPRFFAAFDDPCATVAEWRRRFGAGIEEELIIRAEHLVEGRFDLLGLSDLRFNSHARESENGAAIDWHLEPVAGKRAPLVHWSRVEYLNSAEVGDKKITWELNRQQYFMRLGRAYLLTGDERYAETFVTHLVSWMDANPPKLGINWASSLEVAFRAISWLWALEFFKQSPLLTAEVFARALKLLVVHARHLETYLSTYFSPNTHLTGEALGLFYLGTLLPELKDAARWRERGTGILIDELERHVLPDGVYFEQASCYHRYTVDFYTHFLILARRNELKLSEEVERKLTSLLDHLLFITRPDGRVPLFGDDDGGRLAQLDERDADDFRAALSTGASLFKRPDYKFVAAEAAEETLWLLGPEGLAAFDELPAQAPAETSRAFCEGGYYVMRDGWREDSNYLIIDCGPHGALSCGHGHADALAFELSARGRALLVDPGTYTYTGSLAERNRFRTTAAHNTLVIDGESSSIPGSYFRWESAARARAREWMSHARFDFFEGEHDGYARLPDPATHRRAVVFLKNDYWIMRDRVESEGKHRSELFLHFASDAAPVVERQGGETAYACERAGWESAGLEVFTFCAGGAWREERGWVSRCYGAREPAPVLVYEMQGAGEQEVFTFLVPRAAGETEGIYAREIEAAGGHAFELRGKSLDLLLVGDRGRTVETSRLTSDFEWAWARFSQDGSMLEELILIGGQRLTLDGREVISARKRLPWAHARRAGDELLIETDAGTESVNLEMKSTVTTPS